MRPIISHSAKFLDHLLQPLATSYNNYLLNSNSLTLKLHDMTIPLPASIDVTNLYPSILQSECPHTINEEMVKTEKKHLIQTDPNFIIKLLHIHINNFVDLTFQQIKGTAMGAAFSTSLSNIFMSVMLLPLPSSLHTSPITMNNGWTQEYIIQSW